MTHRWIKKWVDVTNFLHRGECLGGRGRGNNSCGTANMHVVFCWEALVGPKAARKNLTKYFFLFFLLYQKGVRLLAASDAVSYEVGAGSSDLG